jgi:uncharacterized iron-regulated membrane protein
MSAWQRWLRHPESLWVRKCIFYIHLCVGTGAGLYIVLMSFSGSVIVFRNELERKSSIAFIEWLVDLHANLLFGGSGRFVNGIGSICVTLLCLTGAVIWWPGIGNWRRSLTVNWRSHFARINWDLHSALGFWCFLFVFLWGISGFYFSFPKLSSAVFGSLDPSGKFTDQPLFWLSLLHFGRFGWFAEALWTLFGLVPAVLSVTGIFLCCRRMIYGSAVHPSRGPTRNSEMD